MPHMIIANRLVDGLTVFLRDRQRWTDAIEDGVVIDDDADTEQLLSLAKIDEKNCIVIDPYLIEVTIEDGQPRPSVYREAIRAFGPTVRTELMAAGGRE